MADTLGDVNQLARSLLDDAEGTRFTDAVLMPFVNSCYRTLQRRIAENGVQILTDQAQVSVPQGNTEISDAGGATPALPADLIVPHKLWEMPTGSTQKFIEMVRFPGGLPDVDPVERLRYWDWQSNKIVVVQAKVDNTVRIRYEKQFPKLLLTSDPLLIRDGMDALAYGAAFLAAQGHNDLNLANRYQASWEETARQVLNRNVKADQHRARRRKPYSYSRWPVWY